VNTFFIVTPFGLKNGIDLPELAATPIDFEPETTVQPTPAPWKHKFTKRSWSATLLKSSLD